jgi:ABC-type sugar transport system ATPase subunit
MTLCSATGITVRFGGTTALDEVDFDLAAGEVHALVGENGAGKSTLVRVIAGALRPAAGTLTVAPDTPVAWVPQEPELPPDCTAEEWIFLGHELRGRLRWLRQTEMRARAAAALAAIGSRTSPAARCGDLPVSQRKQVQLARALRVGAGVLLLDEPTAVLGADDAARLFTAVRTARAAGAGVVYVSHRLDEVMALADRVTVLRDGRRVATAAVAEVDAHRLVHLMVGREIDAGTRTHAPMGEPLLRIAGLTGGRLDGVALHVRAGEIVGLAGLLGAGRSAVLESIAGLRRCAGTIACAAPPVLLGEDRARTGLVPTFGVRENVFLPAPTWRLREREERRATEEWITRLAIRADGPDAPIASLSGGNQQKTLLARALRRASRCCCSTSRPPASTSAPRPTSTRRSAPLPPTDTAILLASSDLPELLHLCDRVIALYAGRVVGEFDTRTCGEAPIAAAITGQKNLHTEQRSTRRETASPFLRSSV